MKDYTKMLIAITDAYAEDYGLEALIDELFPGISPGELVSEMFEAGMIPEDVIERFLLDE